MTAADYLTRLDEPQKNREVADWFNSLQKNFAMLANNTGTPVEYYPSIRVRDDQSIAAEGTSYAIYINSGLLDYLHNLDTRVFECINSPIAFELLDWKSEGRKLAFNWIMAHEFAHGARKHQDKVNGILSMKTFDEDAISHATEFDADLVATALIFRLVQIELYQRVASGKSSILASDLETRQIAFCVVFNVLRGLVHSASASASHPSADQRFIDIGKKLTIMSYNRGEPLDRAITTDLSRARLRAIANCFSQCERFFIKKYGTQYGELNPGLLTLPGDSPHIGAWEQMDEEGIKNYNRAFRH